MTADINAIIDQIEKAAEGATPECQYSKDQCVPEYRCAVRCVYEEKGFAAGMEQAARIAEQYDDTDTLTAPKAIAAEIRAFGAKS